MAPDQIHSQMKIASQQVSQQQLDRLLTTKQLGLAHFRPTLTYQQATQVLATYNQFWTEESLQCETWTINYYSQWAYLFQHMQEAQCAILNFMYNYKRPQLVKDTFFNSNISFLNLKELSIAWHRIYSCEILTQINAPVLEKLYLFECKNLISVKSLVKLPSQKLRFLTFGSVRCLSFDCLSRLKLNQEKASTVNLCLDRFALHQRISGVKTIFKLELNDNKDESRRYKRIIKCIRSISKTVLITQIFSQEQKQFRNDLRRRELNRYFERYEGYDMDQSWQQSEDDESSNQNDGNE